MTEIGGFASISTAYAAGRARRFAPLAALFVFAIVQQCLGHQNTDNSWLITVCEKILDGARPYVEIVETNPPAAFLIYMPAVALARALGAEPELVVSAFTFFNVAGCLALWSRVSRRAAPAREGFDLPEVAAVFALAVVPGRAFAEREHFAVMWMLPILAVYAARAARAPVGRASAAAAGFLAGMAVCVKPHFAVPLALAFACAAWSRRSPTTALAIENIAAALVALAYGASVVLFFPEYLPWVPEIVDAYVPVKESLGALATEPWFVDCVAVMAAAALVAGRDVANPRVLAPFAASLGFLVTYFWQGKGWMNHALPSTALALVALAEALRPIFEELRARGASAAWDRARPIALYAALPAAVATPLMFGAIYQWKRAEVRPGMAEAVARLAPPRPRLIALSPQLSAGHPLTRRVGGVWAGREHSLLMLHTSRMLIAAGRGDEAYRARLAAYARRDAAMFRADVEANRPDVILVDSDERIAAAIKDTPDLAAALAGYAPRETVDDMVLWTPMR